MTLVERGMTSLHAGKALPTNLVLERIHAINARMFRDAQKVIDMHAELTKETDARVRELKASDRRFQLCWQAIE